MYIDDYAVVVFIGQSQFKLKHKPNTKCKKVDEQFDDFTPNCSVMNLFQGIRSIKVNICASNQPSIT